jgi:hypothetical protein
MIILGLSVTVKPCEACYVRMLSVLRQLLRVRQKRPKTDRDNINYVDFVLIHWRSYEEESAYVIYSNSWRISPR